MPEEMNNNTPNTAQNASETPAATQVASEPKNEAVEPNKAQETQPEPAKEAEAAKEPELTIDSYNSLDLSEYAQEMDLSEAGVAEFKKFGLDNKISPEALKALVDYSVKTMKGQQEAFAKIQEGWRQENAKKYGDNLKNVKTNVGRVLADFDKSGNFANLLKDAGAEENPATLEFLNSLADVLLEKGSINPNASPEGKEYSLEDMYKPKN